MSNHTELSLKFVGDIHGHFWVPRYQRGYRWGAHETRQLLDDIWENRDRPYSLQPIVVKRLEDDRWELIDGQQRLTTLYLVMTYMEREGLQRSGAPYDLEYETRPGSAEYLRSLDPELHNANIDYFHMFSAYECIREWCEAHGNREEYVANKIHQSFFESVQVIWYEAEPELDSTTLFTRLNVGRIPLTNAELVKALILAKADDGPSDRTFEIAAQWDAIERDLRRPDVWAFVSGRDPDENPTRIDLLLDTLAGGPKGRERPLFHTFDVVRQRVLASSAIAVWDQIQDLHALVRGWFEDRDLFHKVGYLVACGTEFGALVDEARGCTKSNFQQRLDQRIAETLKLTREGLQEIGYETKRRTSERVLMLMNVETVRRLKNSSERYPFDVHAGTGWSIEHIHAQNAELLTRAEQWESWLAIHRDVLSTFTGGDAEEREGLVVAIDRVSDDLDGDKFQALAERITRCLTPDEDADDSVHTLANLALLSSGDNSALSNAVFEVKRRRILEMDRRGSYIPICTRRAFLKYYADADSHQNHFWSSRDRQAYMDALIGAVEPYLQTDEAH